MARIAWDNPEDRIFEAGVDRAVLYPRGGAGVPWNGLVNVNETPSGGTAIPYYYDGFKYLNEASPVEFEATLEAFTWPDEFIELDGMAVAAPGLYFDEQPRDTFGLVYRSLVGNGLNGFDFGQKIHLVYNALAAPTEKSRATLGSSTDPTNFTWAITTTPLVIRGYRPFAHVVIDSTKTSPTLIRAIEDILYGTSSTDARMLSVSELVEMFANPPVLLQIVPDPAHGLLPLVEDGLADLIGPIKDGIYEIPSESRLAETSKPGYYTLET